MRLTVTDKALFEGIQKAFQEREHFTLTGAGVAAKLFAGDLNYFPFGHPDFSRKPAIELSFEPASVAAVEWDGEGLPPVGLAVEAYYAQDTLPGWKPFKLKYLSEESVVFEGMGETYRDRETFDRWALKFRSICSAVRIAAEEREKAIAEMTEIARAATADNPRGGVGAAALYDAGYRLMEGKK